jgi:4-hydroxy-tetrahydrodipicolinate reductase
MQRGDEALQNIKILHIGLGPLGQKIIKYISERKGLETIGAVDTDPEKAGKDIGEICSLGKNLGIRVSSDPASAMAGKKPDAVLLTTVSSLEKLACQVEEIAGYGLNIVSTCEELSFPWGVQTELALKLDGIAKKHNIAILGTGVNPGFLMDYLPIVLTGVCQEVKSIKVSRIQDASFRRIPFKKKIGAGLTLEEFNEKCKQGALRHVGLTESIHMIADRMKWKLDGAEDIITPVVAAEDTISGETVIQAGTILGVQQIGKGYINGEEKITLVFRASIGEKNPADTIEIKGLPDITSTIPGGVNGDVATCAITINAVRSITGLPAGLKTMVDLPVTAFFSE